MLEGVDLTADVWELTSDDVIDTDWSETILVFTSQMLLESGGLTVEGYFEWIGSNDSYGREVFQGTVSADGFFEETSSELIPPSTGITTSNFIATLSADATTLLNGSVSGGVDGDFTAEREDKNYVRTLINFETLPGGEVPVDGEAISDQFLSGDQIRFSQLNGDPATIAQSGGTTTAFLSESRGADLVLSNRQAEVGTFFLTDDGTLSGREAGLVIDLAEPASEIRGALLDIDFDEEWFIAALDASGQTIDTETIASGDPFTGDGMLTNFVVQAADGENNINRVEFTSDRDAAGAFGFALDNLAIERLSNQSDGSDDLVNGSPDNDSISANPGDETIDGGAGTDTVIYSGEQSNFTLTLDPESITVTDRRTDGQGSDELRNIEILDFGTELAIFGGGPMNLDIFDDAASLSASEFASIVELYIAYFNRAPDAIGLNFWASSFARGEVDIAQMAELFFDQPETREAYTDVLDATGSQITDIPAFVTAVYSNVLGRAFDEEGRDFWVGALESGGITTGAFIGEIIKGAKADPPSDASQDFIDQQLVDQQYLADKTDVGVHFAVINGMSDTDNAAATMALFTGSQDSINAAVAQSNEFLVEAEASTGGEFLMPLVGVLDDPFGVA